MISNQTTITFILSKSRTPTIISPKTDYHWSSSKSVLFKWKYNGEDIHLEYQIQIIKTKITKRSSISTTLSSYESNPELYSIFEFSDYSNLQEILLDLSSEITEDGVYIWRIRTRGTLSREWSDWAEDGLLRIDSLAPYIRNVAAITKCPLGKLASSISDLSSPYIYTKRNYESSVVKDRHVDRDGQPGLYIYYDYRDNSINIKAQSGKENSKRYYGMISFHKNDNSLTEILGSGQTRTYDNRYSIQSLVKSVYQYSINKKENNLGPFDDIPSDLVLNGKKYFLH